MGFFFFVCFCFSDVAFMGGGETLLAPAARRFSEPLGSSGRKTRLRNGVVGSGAAKEAFAGRARLRN